MNANAILGIEPAIQLTPSRSDRATAAAAIAAGSFQVDGELVALSPTGNGNVNDTYLATFRTSFSQERIIVQKINRHVFPRPAAIMANMRVVTEHVHHRLAAEGAQADRVWQLPRVIPGKDGKDYYRNGDGEYWRAISLIDSATSYATVQGTAHAREAGSVLGQFHRLVADLNPTQLEDPLPGFHVTPLYLEKYDDILPTPAAQVRLSRQAGTAGPRLARFIEERRGFGPVLEQARANGELTLRLIHGDPKVSNIMIDNLTGKGTCIVDLDTVKPGLIHYDFGDALRSLANRAGEETANLSEVAFDVELCQAFAAGYMQYAREFLTDQDRYYLYDAIRLLAFELGLRFFQDYLAGDVYFKVHYPEQNLRRARVQFHLCESIEAQESAIRDALQRTWQDGHL